MTTKRPSAKPKRAAPKERSAEAPKRMALKKGSAEEPKRAAPSEDGADPVVSLQEAIRAALRAHGEPAKAEGMRAYMKSAMPCFGVPATPLRALLKPLFVEYTLSDKAAWQRAVLTIYREAEHREERYAAIELSGARPYKGYQDLDAVPMYEEMIVTGAWWDLVDTIAVHRIGPILRANPKPMKKLLLAWSRGPHMWKRRTAILSQIAFKKATDVDLLGRVIEPNMADKEFFLRKGIGWALRAHAYVDPEWVRRFVRENEGALSGLSKREALKNIGEGD